MPKKIRKGDPLVSPGMVCYAGKQEKPLLFHNTLAAPEPQILVVLLNSLGGKYSPGQRASCLYTNEIMNCFNISQLRVFLTVLPFKEEIDEKILIQCQKCIFLFSLQQQ